MSMITMARQKGLLGKRIDFFNHSGSEFTPVDYVSGYAQSNDNDPIAIERTDIMAHCMTKDLGAYYLRQMSYAQRMACYIVFLTDLQRRLERKQNTLGARYPIVYNGKTDSIEGRYGNGGVDAPTVAAIAHGLLAMQYNGTQYAIDESGKIVAQRTV